MPNKKRQNYKQQAEIAIAALTEIASFNDQTAQGYLKKTGSYAYFDEPGSVETAREALAEIERNKGNAAVKSFNSVYAHYTSAAGDTMNTQRIAYRLFFDGKLQVRLSGRWVKVPKSNVVKHRDGGTTRIQLVQE